MTLPDTERSYGGRSVTDRRAERRARFIDGAVTVFSDKGYAKSSITDICASVELSRRQFYEEFGSREDLLIAVYDKIQDDARAALVAALEGSTSTDPSELATAVMTAYVESVGGDARRAKIAFVEIVGVSERVEQHRFERRTNWIQLYEAATHALFGGIENPPRGGSAMSAIAFIGAVNGLVHQWTIVEPKAPIADLVEVLSRVLLGLVKGPDPVA
ncbi:TetR/AcrR family transcriptional regulator [Antrihabitans spumae]|uniref:TetR/AcrR family transcriptional regulator n=1 Tax=Antrihabitans spumae TaxID=3373370 RepID=A0ABW7KEP5_9NOCA